MEENRKKQERRYPSQLSLTIRVIVGGYLDYEAYSIMTSGLEKSPYIYIAVVAFVIIGTILAAWSLLYLALGKYEGGKADHWAEDHPEEVEETAAIEAIEENEEFQDEEVQDEDESDNTEESEL